MRIGLWATAAGTALMLVARTAAPERQTPIDGFAPMHLAAQHDVERRLARFPSASRLAADHQFLTAEPHIAGSLRDRELAEWTRDQWVAAGLDSVEIVEHHALLPYPRQASVEMLSPYAWHAALREHPADPIAFHAYSASGDVTAPVVSVGTGTAADFDRLAAEGIDVRGKIALVRYPVSYSYRGYAVYLAQHRGAAAVLMYAAHSDAVPDDAIQRGGVGFDFIAPGDPTAASRPTILSLPISTRDAHVILDAMRIGTVTLRVRASNDEAVRSLWTVVGRLNGSTHPDQWVIAGNHRDAWVYGGVDPSSGSTVLMEMARSVGALAKSGARPTRTIVLASWDGEEYAMTSSTEWGEQHERELREKAVAYLNVDAAVSGATFSARAVPSLVHFVASAAGVADSAIDTRVGAGSDYTVFLNHVGVPIVDLRFEGPYPVYHSAYDTHEWVSRIDPDFKRHAELTRIWSTMAMRLANADVLPLDAVRYAHHIRQFLTDVEARWHSPLTAASKALARLDAAASGHGAATADALAADDAASLDLLNRALLEMERAFIDPAGLNGRPWYRHQIYAPTFTYQPEVLPALTEAVDAHDDNRVAEAERRLAAAIDRAAERLKVFTTFPAVPAS
jgi:N-acetylated-alpha-linked acidic dipeptidase